MPSNHRIFCRHFSSCPQSFLASGSFQMSQLFTSGGQSIGASASASVFPMTIQGWFSLGLTGLISLQSKGLSTVFSRTTVLNYQFFSAQPFYVQLLHRGGKKKMFSFFCPSLSVLVLLFLSPPSWALFLSPRADFKTRFFSILYPTLTHLFSPIHLPPSLTLVCLLDRVSSKTLKQRVVDLFL